MTKFKFGHASLYTLKDLFYDHIFCRFVGIGGGGETPPIGTSLFSRKENKDVILSLEQYIRLH